MYALPASLQVFYTSTVLKLYQNRSTISSPLSSHRHPSLPDKLEAGSDDGCSAGCSSTRPLSSLPYMYYPQLTLLLLISLPGGEEVPALESTSSSPASPMSQPTPLLDHPSWMCDQNFVTGEFLYGWYVFLFIVGVLFVPDRRYS